MSEHAAAHGPERKCPKLCSLEEAKELKNVAQNQHHICTGVRGQEDEVEAVCGPLDHDRGFPSKARLCNWKIS